MVNLVQVFLLDKYLKLDFPTSHGGKRVIHMLEIPSHQGKQVARLNEGVFPTYPMTRGVGLHYPLCDAVAIGKQDRIALGICNDSSSKPAHDIGPIQIVSDAPEAFSLTLGTKHLLRLIQSFQCSVVLRLNPGTAVQGE